MKRPMFKLFNNLEEKLPVIELADLPTPVENFNDSQNKNSDFNNLWIKRDDKTSAIYGGNKVRKLEFILADAKKNNKDTITTFGATGTNHGVATSIFAGLFGLKSKIYLFDQPVTKTVITNLKLMIKNQATLIHKGSLFNTALNYYTSYLGSKNQYHLPPGGSNIMGCIGFVNAAFELKEQIEQGILPEPDHIICPVGSSGTLAGLTLGCQLAGLKSEVRGIRVAPSHLGIIPICTTKTVTELMKKTFHHLRFLDSSIANISLKTINLDDNYYGDGYGIASEKGDFAMTTFARREIPLESTYTAKAAAAAIDLCSENPHDKVLYWHTFNSVELNSELSNNELTSLSKPLRTVIG